MRTRVTSLCLSLAAFAALGALAAFTGCGGTSGPGAFQSGQPDAGSPGTQLDGSLTFEAGGSIFEDAATASCNPASVTSFKPEWRPPTSFKSGACTNLQISSFFDACLGTSSTPGGCTAYVQANSACASCLQSDDTDTTLGPVIWHSNRTYYTTNIAGCVADEQGDAGAGGCGAAYQATVDCKETACVACATSTVVGAYQGCEEQAGANGCQAYIKTLNTSCGAVLQDTSSPVAVCLPPSSDTAEDAYLQLAPVFCGQ